MKDTKHLMLQVRDTWGQKASRAPPWLSTFHNSRRENSKWMICQPTGWKMTPRCYLSTNDIHQKAQILFHLREYDSYSFSNVSWGGEWLCAWGPLPIKPCFPTQWSQGFRDKRTSWAPRWPSGVLLPALALQTKARKDGPLERGEKWRHLWRCPPTF